ncbi:MAG: DNA/RNA nuclease SfsA [Bacillota bacterium]
MLTNLYLMPPVIEALFLKRENRFLARVYLDQKEELAHVPNSGRLLELLAPGKTIYLTRKSPVENHPPGNKKRKTSYTVVLAERGENLVAIDAHLANHLARAAITQGGIPELAGYCSIRPECRCGDSRFDFLLVNPTQQCWLEIKSVTLVDGGVARFPDAPTVRGKKHLYGLTQLCQSGFRAVVLFMVQGEDALRFSPHDQTDPEFGAALRAAAAAGVEVLAYNCRATLRDIDLIGKIPVRL